MAKSNGAKYPRLAIGQKFDTDFESGCIATSEIDEYGSFTALDSEGVECSFSASMIEVTYQVEESDK